MKISAIFLSLLLIVSAAFAAPLPTRFVVSELVKNSGSGIYQIEQEVHFPTSGEPLVLRETWWIENDGSMRLHVNGLRELKDQFRLQYVYQNGQRFGNTAQVRMTKKADENLIDKYFHFRNSDRLLSELVSLRVIPPANAARKSIRSIKDADYKPEANVRLARVGGSIAVALGTPAPVDGEPTPGFWIEQDTFALRKFRLPSQVEVTAERFMQSPRGLLFPRSRTVRWGPHTVQIETLSVAPKADLKANFFQAAGLDSTNKMEGIQDPALKALVEDFYLRFR